MLTVEDTAVDLSCQFFGSGYALDPCYASWILIPIPNVDTCMENISVCRYVFFKLKNDSLVLAGAEEADPS